MDETRQTGLFDFATPPGLCRPVAKLTANIQTLVELLWLKCFHDHPPVLSQNLNPPRQGDTSSNVEPPTIVLQLFWWSDLVPKEMTSFNFRDSRSYLCQESRMTDSVQASDLCASSTAVKRRLPPNHWTEPLTWFQGDIYMVPTGTVVGWVIGNGAMFWLRTRGIAQRCMI